MFAGFFFVMKFEQEGLFLGLISFPFYIDGGNLYSNIFAPFFEKHRNDYIQKYEICDDVLYKPMAYRMFGTHGLAILSLIDDFAFSCRIFNPSHIDTILANSVNYDEIEPYSLYKSIAITGTSETKDEAYLKDRATLTFLAEREIYPFIGIIRMKIDHRILSGRGIDVTRGIKRVIENKKDIHNKCTGNENRQIETIVVDTYDNDEMVLVAFSTCYKTIYRFLTCIRRLTCEDIDGISFDFDGIKHVFSSCHLSYGYHIGYSFEEKIHIGFKPVVDYDNKDLLVNFLCETKPGHRKELISYLTQRANDILYEQRIQKTATGGSIIHAQFHVKYAKKLQLMACEEEFKQHVRRVKLTLNDSNNSEFHPKESKHYCKDENTIKVPLKDIRNIRNILNEIGVSKIIRDRLLSLLDLYNDCSRNKLQVNYFEQLSSSANNIINIIKCLDDANEDIASIEKSLNAEIEAFEVAVYNRIHNTMSPNTTLEYSCGIQQYLQALGFSYKSVVNILNPAKANCTYTCITGMEKVSSMRTHIELNINHILYPQLFATTIWKEAGNFSMPILESYRAENFSSYANSINQTLLRFQDFIFSSHSFDQIRYILFQEGDGFYKSDKTLQIINTLIDNKLVKYIINDFNVYHFAFQRNFEMMWHYYFQVLLQTTNVYYRKGKIKNASIIHLLIRLFIVGMADKSRYSDNLDYIDKQRTNPYDYTISSVWVEVYEKTNKACLSIFKTLDSYGLSEVCEMTPLLSELNIIKDSNDLWEHFEQSDLFAINEINQECIRLRETKIDKAVDCFKSKKLITAEEVKGYTTEDNVLCILNAFLKYLFLFDKDKIIRTPIEFDCNKKDDDLYNVMSNYLIDTTGGYYLPKSLTRKDFFATRTTLYRSLWNISYKH